MINVDKIASIGVKPTTASENLGQKNVHVKRGINA